MVDTDRSNFSSKNTTLNCEKVLKGHQKCKNNGDIKKQLVVYLQNIRSLKNKINELLISLTDKVPDVLCLTEHHLRDYEINNTCIPTYKLGAKYCRNYLKQGGACVYVHESLDFKNINMQKYCSKQDIELAAIQIKKRKGNIIIICIYRAPTGNFDIFLHNLEIVLHTYYTHTTDIIICGDININYLEPDDKKDQLNNLLDTFNITATVTFQHVYAGMKLPSLIIFLSIVAVVILLNLVQMDCLIMRD